MGSNGLMAFMLIAAVIAIAIAIAQTLGKNEKAKELNAIDKVTLGKYLVGLKESKTPAQNITCVITEDDFIFLSAFGTSELGRIPRKSINQIIFDDKSQITQRLTVTRLLTLGPFALAAPKKKKHKEFCLVIDWDDDNGIKWNTIFEFSGLASETLASQAFNKLNGYIKPKVLALPPDEMKCPYCAELIKREAKICRFCNRDVISSTKDDSQQNHPGVLG